MASKPSVWESRIGNRYGRLVVTGIAGRDHASRALINCVCDCGNTIVIEGSHLTGNCTKSCGCYHKERLISDSTVHGMCYAVSYTHWNGIMDRCYNPNSVSYRMYGGRGIHICDSWKDPKVFDKWFTSNNGAKNMDIHRIDNDGDYSPDNCIILSKSDHLKLHGRKTRQTNAKLDYELAEEIRGVYEISEHISQRYLAEMYGVSQKTILNIIKRRIYRFPCDDET